MCNYTSSYAKVDLCAHTYGKIGEFYRRVYSAYILTRTPPPPFAQVDGGGCYREKFFIFFRFSFYTRLITIWGLLHIVENYGFDIISRFRISDSEFRLVSALFILCFNSSPLYLFNSSACYKQTSMLMQSLVYACFGYFKAFWRVFVCFRCSLSSWVKIMRQKV